MKNFQIFKLTKIILFLSIFVSSFTCFSQNSEWTKDDRNTIYNEYLDALTKYKNISVDQKKSIALDCMKEITKKYTRKDYRDLIDVELERIQEATINTSAKNVGVSLQTEVKAVKEETRNDNNGFREEDFSGMWTSEIGDYTFMAKDKTYTCKSATNRGCMNDRGDFVIKGRGLIIKSGRDFCPWAEGKFTIISVSSEEIVLSDKSNNRELRLKKIK